MVAAHGNQTVFTVLGEAARRRGTIGLFSQLTLSIAITTAVLVAAPHWWSVAFLAGWSAAYSGWGLLARVADARENQTRSFVILLKSIAVLGTVLAVAGIIGIGLAFYTGNGRGVKNACGANSTNKLCRAFADPTQASGPIK
jgi:hypothetical protein